MQAPNMAMGLGQQEPDKGFDWTRLDMEAG